MNNKPNNILLEGSFIQEGVDNKVLKEKIVHARCKIHKKGNDELGNKDYVALEPYTQRVKARVVKIKIPYLLEEPMFPKVIGPTPIPVEDLKGLQVALARMNQERDVWERKFHISKTKRL